MDTYASDRLPCNYDKNNLFRKKMMMKKLLAILLSVLMLIVACPVYVGADASESTLPFPDVSTSDWFYSSVAYTYENGLINGFGDGTFKPYTATTRGMVVAILYNLEEKPEVEGIEFPDVPSGKWYEQPIGWAAECGIVSGYGDGNFRPDTPITREQMAVIMRNYASYKGFDVSVSADFSDYQDHDKVSSYAAESMSWAIATGIITGVGGTQLNPKGNATRAQVSAILQRFISNVVNQPEFQILLIIDGEEYYNGSILAFHDVAETGKSNPYMSGFTFDGWYIDEACTAKYDINLPVSKDLTLYGTWVPADDYNSVEDDTVTEDDTYVLSASCMDFDIGYDENIYFYVDTNLAITGGFSLYCNGGDTGIVLYDDGDYEAHGDDIPEDGRYSGVLYPTVTEEGDNTFTAKTLVGETMIETEPYEVFFYYEFSDDEAEEMEDISEGIAIAMNEALSSVTEGSDEDAAAEAKASAVMDYLNGLVDEGTITDLSFDEETGIICYIYVPTGTERYVFCGDEEYGEGLEQIGGREARLSDEAEFLEKDAEAQYVSAGTDSGVDYVTYKEKALILCYEASNDNGYAIDAANVKSKLDNAGFETNIIYTAGVGNFKGMQDYDYIFVAHHGNTQGVFGKEPVICTPEIVTKENKKTYSHDIKKKRISEVDTTSGTKYWIKPQFFKDYYSSDKLKCRIFSLGCCKGGYNSKLADALIEAGADTVTAYSDTVYIFYDNDMEQTILDELLKGKNISAAVSNAKTVNGNNDLEWSAKRGFSKKECAELNIYGDTGTKIHSSLLNGSFDNFFNLVGSGISDWKAYGDVRGIYHLGGIIPKSPLKMAMISSGFGSQNGETYSCMYQTILVPGSAKSISFSYDVVSEEPMEYVGTEYDDAFKAEILDTDGTVLATLATETVNASSWYAVIGIDFPEGDDTMYHTRWKTVSSNLISDFRNRLVVIKFSVEDAGDSIFDTAALIDSVSIN